MRGFTLSKGNAVHVYDEPTNMGASFPKLTKLVRDEFKVDPVESGDLYLFVNGKKNYVKLLFWAKNGWCIFAKKLPVGTFSFKGGKISIGDMQRVLDAVSVKRRVAFAKAA
jgi:transposase